jgi:hypothetical protein
MLVLGRFRLRCATPRIHPPWPPLCKGGKWEGSGLFLFPPLRRGGVGGVLREQAPSVRDTTAKRSRDADRPGPYPVRWSVTVVLSSLRRGAGRSVSFFAGDADWEGDARAERSRSARLQPGPAGALPRRSNAHDPARSASDLPGRHPAGSLRRRETRIGRRPASLPDFDRPPTGPGTLFGPVDGSHGHRILPGRISELRRGAPSLQGWGGIAAVLLHAQTNRIESSRRTYAVPGPEGARVKRRPDPDSRHSRRGAPASGVRQSPGG